MQPVRQARRRRRMQLWIVDQFLQQRPYHSCPVIGMKARRDIYGLPKLVPEVFSRTKLTNMQVKRSRQCCFDVNNLLLVKVLT